MFVWEALCTRGDFHPRVQRKPIVVTQTHTIDLDVVIQTVAGKVVWSELSKGTLHAPLTTFHRLVCMHLGECFDTKADSGISHSTIY